ncbi:MAG: cbb3-type cytochrome c oxidase subunit 3 [Gammaproteobacteria bacterium]|jgi:cytochrome c oxidase cbb3-type subunit 4|nr:MAG: cbb3-type cytochrome c oxidase subunit 3 [Gammaproteobacteria bacterium]
MDIAVFHSWWTVLLVVIFIGIVAWAWSGRRRQSFDEAAKMPLEDDTSGGVTGERNNG